MNTYHPSLHHVSLVGQLFSVLVDDWSVQLVIEDGSPHLDIDSLEILHGKTVQITMVSADVGQK